MSLLGDNPEKVIIQEIKDFVAKNPGNRDARLKGKPFFEDPLVGFADARDPLFETYKDILLNTAFRNSKTYLASSFNYSFIKKRLLMMTKKTLSKVKTSCFRSS